MSVNQNPKFSAAAGTGVTVTRSAGGGETISAGDLSGSIDTLTADLSALDTEVDTKFAKAGGTITGATTIDGSADAVQLTVQGHSTQTSLLLVLENSAGADQVTVSNVGKVYMAGEAEIDGALNHDGSTAGFYGVTPASRPTAYTQTYSTATRTHSNPTASALTDNSGGSANTTIEAMPDPADAPLTADILRDDLVANFILGVRNNIADLTAQVNALIADLANTKQVLNQVIDDHQANGLLQ
jgi:hypothetical protein